MSIYFRSENPLPLSPRRARLLSAHVLGMTVLIYLAAGPMADRIGALAGPAVKMVELALMLWVAYSWWQLCKSNYQRIVGEQTAKLDEFEIAQRLRANDFAYRAVFACVPFLLFYMMASTGIGRELLWMPQSSNDWYGVFLTAMVFLSILPTTYLAWTMPPAPERE